MVQFRIDVKVDPSGAVRGIDRVDKRLDRTASKVDRLGRLMRNAFLFGGLTLGVNQLISTLADYEQQMATVRGITGASADEFDRLRKETQRLGATTRFSASQAAEGAAFLGRAGFDTAAIMESLDDTLTLAQAGMLDLGRAADIASNVLTGFRLPVSDASRVVDVLAYTANNANTDINQLGDAMKFVAPVAAGLGVSVEEASAAIAKLSDAGLQASMAGTGLRRVLAELESPASKTRKIFAALGVDANEVRISQVGLTAAIERLAKAGLDTGQALEVFGDRGGPAFEVLRSSVDDVRAMNEELQDVEGYAKGLSETMDDNLNGSLLAVKSAFEAVVIAFGEAGATSGLRTALDAVASILRTVANNADLVLFAIEALLAAMIAQRVLAFAAALRQAAAGMVALELALGAGSVSAARLSAGLKAVLLPARALNVVMRANPFVAVASAIVLTVGALYSLRDTLKVSGDGMATLGDFGAVTFEKLTAGAQAVGRWFRDTFGPLVGFIEGIVGDIELSFGGMLRFLTQVIDAQVGLFRGAYEAVKAIWNGLPSFFKSIAAKAVNFLISDLEAGINRIGSALSFISGGRLGGSVSLTRVEGGAEDAGESVGEAFRRGYGKGAGLTDVVDGIIDEAEARALSRAERLAGEGLSGSTVPGGTSDDPLGTGSGGLGEDGSSSAKKDAEEVNELLEAKKAILEELRGPVGDLQLRQTALNELYRDGIISLAEYTNQLHQLRAAALETSNTLGGGIRAGLERVAAQAGELGKQVSNFVVGAFEQASDAVVEFAKTGKLNIRDFFSDLAGQLLKLATNQLFSSLLSGLLGPSGFGSGGGLFSGFLGSLGGAGLPGFATGGSSMVGGAGGTDSQLVQFRATPGERVDVLTPAQQRKQAQQAQGGNGGQTVLQVAVVLSEDDVASVFDGPRGDRLVVRGVEKNKQAVRKVVQSA